jgi:hypothetical protein
MAEVHSVGGSQEVFAQLRSITLERRNLT